MTGFGQKKFNYVPEQGLLTSCDLVSSKRRGRREGGKREAAGLQEVQGVRGYESSHKRKRRGKNSRRIFGKNCKFFNQAMRRI